MTETMKWIFLHLFTHCCDWECWFVCFMFKTCVFNLCKLCDLCW